MKLTYAVFIVAISFIIISLPAIAYEREDLRLLLKKSVNNYDQLLNTMTEKEFRDVVRLYFQTADTGNKINTQSNGIYSGKSYDALISSVQSVVWDCKPGETATCGISVGVCKPGTQICGREGMWSSCVGGVQPSFEVCDNLDNDCDGMIDEDGVCRVSCVDNDRDGFGTGCSKGDDCNDNLASVNKDASEVCSDGIDNDCDGLVDGEDSECVSITGITSPVPPAGSYIDITFITLTGKNFANGAQVMVGGTGVSTTFNSPTELRATLPPSSSPGPVDITVTNPDGSSAVLKNGFTYYGLVGKAFITSKSYTGNLGGISGADAKCQAHADEAGLGGKWVAWLSTSAVNAKDRIYDRSYVMTDGITKIAGSLADITDGSLQNPVSMDENKNKGGQVAWTGTTASGTNSGSNCNDWTSGTSSHKGLFGSVYYNDYRWTAWQDWQCDASLYLYCFQQWSGATTPDGSPAITSVSPPSGTPDGGTKITITGTGFLKSNFANPVVNIGNKAATVSSVESNTITAVTPPTPFQGAVDVTVINPDGKSAVLKGGFTYSDKPLATPAPKVSSPVIDSIIPYIGKGRGGTMVTIQGKDFAVVPYPWSIVTRNSINISNVFGKVIFGQFIARVYFADSTKIVALAPPGYGEVDVTVTNPDGGSVTKLKGFKYTAPPFISGIYPRLATTYGGTVVALNGFDFGTAPKVSFGGSPAQVLSSSSNSIKAVAPAHATGRVDVSVINPDSQAYTWPDAFNYTNQPGIPTTISVSPPFALESKAIPVEIYGYGFKKSAKVNFGISPATEVVFVDSTKLKAIAPPGKGEVDVTVTNPDGNAHKLSNAFAYTPQLPMDVNVLVLKYFPLDEYGKLDKQIVGDLDMTLQDIQLKVKLLTEYGVKISNRASVYKSYKVGGAPSVQRKIIAEREYLEPIPPTFFILNDAVRSNKGGEKQGEDGKWSPLRPFQGRSLFMDLGSQYTLSTFTLYFWSFDRPEQFHISVSTTGKFEGEEKVVVVEKDGLSEYKEMYLSSPIVKKTYTFSSINGRYVKLVVDAWRNDNPSGEPKSQEPKSLTNQINLYRFDPGVSVPFSSTSEWSLLGDAIPRANSLRYLERENICYYVDQLGVKEVWVWMYHSSVVYPIESNMVMGKKIQEYWNFKDYGDVSNSGRGNDLPICDNTYTVYEFNYQRGLGEMMEDFGHQYEHIFNYVSDGKERDDIPPSERENLLFWGKFVGESSIVISPELEKPGCGWTHITPNGKSDYDWWSEEVVMSDCEDWKPDGTGFKKPVNCHTWSGDVCVDDGGVAWKTWWMQNFPGMDNGLTYNGVPLRNWWEFIGDFDTAIQKGRSLTEGGGSER